MRKVIKAESYNGNPLSGSWKNNEGFYEEILQSLNLLFEDMTSRNARIYFSMYNLTFPAGSISNYPSDNSLLSKFIEALMRQYKNMECDAKYLWARENSSTGQFHYHLVLLVDGNKVQDGHLILRAATKIWQRCLGIENGKGLVDLSAIDKHEYNYYKNGIKINSNDENFIHVYNKCYQLASYVAKRYSKNLLPVNVNGYGSSHIS